MPIDGAVVHWTDRRGGGSRWRVPLVDALFAVLVSEPRDIAIAACCAALHHRRITTRDLDVVFARAPARVRPWRAMVSALDESHGETLFRTRYVESGRSCEQQITIEGIGRFDFRVSEHVYVEVDGGQHDPAWSGGGASSWANDLDRDAAMTIRGDRVIHIGYRQLYGDWPTVLAAIDRAVADDAALAARRRQHPYRPRTQRKRRTSAANWSP
jgi:very-short-patch-repair endonuclease